MNEAGIDVRTPQQIAEAVAAGMFRNDRASRAMGMRIIEVGPGRATLEMTVRDDMLNGFDICHGGFITTLADSAFAFACNSYNEMTVASSLSVDLVAVARVNDVLSARATEVHQAGRTGVYDMTVTNQRGELVACVRGRSYRMKGRTVVSPDAPAAQTIGAQP
ncbi:MAG: hydroxyphenylacetyl-CoA thioesterase PaaI [Burkholderiaceae bacterium]